MESTAIATRTTYLAYTNQLTETQHRKTSMFAVFGLNDSQFILIAVLIIVVVGLAMLYVYKNGVDQK